MTSSECGGARTPTDVGGASGTAISLDQIRKSGDGESASTSRSNEHDMVIESKKMYDDESGTRPLFSYNQYFTNKF